MPLSGRFGDGQPPACSTTSKRNYFCDTRHYRESDSDPKERFLYHAAGWAGFGTSSYIDLVVLRDRDANSGWTAASDGTLEERVYPVQNWRADVVALVKVGDQTQEWIRYSAYGVPFGMPGGDTDSDGDCDSTDVTQVQTWIDAAAYDVRGDIDLDGDADATDKSTIQSSFLGAALGRGTLSATGIRNRKGYAGYEFDIAIGQKYHVRHRVLDSVLGRWLRRDPLGYVDGANLFLSFLSTPISRLDPMGSDCFLPLPPNGVARNGYNPGGNYGGPQPGATMCDCAAVITIDASDFVDGGPGGGAYLDWGFHPLPRSGPAYEITQGDCCESRPCTFRFQLTLNVEPFDPEEPQKYDPVTGKMDPFYEQWHGPNNSGATWYSPDPETQSDFEAYGNKAGTSTPQLEYDREVPCGESVDIPIIGTNHNGTMALNFFMSLSCLECSPYGTSAACIGDVGSTTTTNRLVGSVGASASQSLFGE